MKSSRQERKASKREEKESLVVSETIADDKEPGSSHTNDVAPSSSHIKNGHRFFDAIKLPIFKRRNQLSKIEGETESETQSIKRRHGKLG